MEPFSNVYCSQPYFYKFGTAAGLMNDKKKTKYKHGPIV